MTLREMLERICTQMGLDELEAEQKNVVGGYIGEALEDFFGLYRPFVDAQVVLEHDGYFSLAQMDARAGRLFRVLDGYEEVPFRMGDGRVMVALKAGACVSVRYRQNPVWPKEEGDVPDLPAAYHGALCDYATYRLLMNEGELRQKRGEVFYVRYLQKRTAIAVLGQVWREQIIHKYG